MRKLCRESEKMCNYYQIVTIIANGTSLKENLNVIVPKPWVFKRSDRQYVSYPEPPYSADDLDMIDSFVQAKAIPPDDWFHFECNSGPISVSYNEAKLLLQAVQNKNKYTKNDVTESAGNITQTSVLDKEVFTDILYNVSSLNNDVESPGPGASPSTSKVGKRKIDEVDGQSAFQGAIKTNKIINSDKSEDTLERINNNIRKLQDMIMRNVVPRLRHVEIDLNEIKTLVSEKRILKEVDSIITFEKFQELYASFPFPIPHLEGFLDFDEDLKVNRRDMKELLKKHFVSTINTQTDVVDTIRCILKKFFKRDVLLQYVVQKKIKEKLVFKDTSFYGVMQDSLTNCFCAVGNPISEKSILHALGMVFNSVKDWEGHRINRLNKTL